MLNVIYVTLELNYQMSEKRFTDSLIQSFYQILNVCWAHVLFFHKTILLSIL